MSNENMEPNNLLDVLKEREKELNCLYMVDEILENHQLSLPELFNAIIKVLPSGWRFPNCAVLEYYTKTKTIRVPDLYPLPSLKHVILNPTGILWVT